MADFLESFDFGSDGPRKPRDTRCASVSELADNLRGAVAAKTTPSRAEHVTVTYELRNTARFALTPADQGYDEAVGPTAAAPNPETEPQGGEKTTVTANQVILNQTDDPTRQRAVAVHIVRALGAADGCAWVVRESSRARHGWSFRYACAASHSEWIRRSAKDPPKTTIGDWSLRVPDQALMGALVVRILKESAC